MKITFTFLALLAFLGCNKPGSSSSTATSKAAKPVVKVAETQKPEAPKTDSRPAFDEKEMTKPITEYLGVNLPDYRKLPNCLEVLKSCNAIPFEGKTSEQYKDAVQKVAMQACRMELKVSDIPSDYDYALFEMLSDDGKPALDILKEMGNLGDYSKYYKFPFAINDAKKKGLDSKKRAIGDKVVLVGVGYIVLASPWSAASPTHGVPRGDSRHVTLRAFGKPNRYHPNEYEFAFMLRNWYIAEQ